MKCISDTIKDRICRTSEDFDRARRILELRKSGEIFAQIGAVLRLSERQVQRLQSLLQYPNTVKAALEKGEITTTHAFILMQAKRKYGARFDLGKWMRVAREKSIGKLQVAIQEYFPGGEQDRPLFSKKGNTIKFNLFHLRIAPKATKDATIRKLRKILQTLEEE